MDFLARRLSLPPAGTESFFLWGARQTGKSSLLSRVYPAPSHRWIYLCEAEEYRRYLERPELLRQELLEVDTSGKQIVIDGVQRVPALLDPVRWLAENRGVCFALCGSSVREVERGAARLLGGRGLRRELHGLTAAELGDAFDLTRVLNRGYLPGVDAATRPCSLLDAYIADYLREEVAANQLVRNLPAFSRFLDTAALSDTELVNFSMVARACGVSNHTARSYFRILEDTLLGRWLPAYRKRAKRRVISSPKFFFSDVGVVNRLARRRDLEPGSELYGKALENWVFHELTAYLSYEDVDATLSYWRLASGIEVDFIVGDMELAVEAKATARVTSDHLKGLRHLARDHRVQRRIVVSLEAKPYRTDDWIEVIPAARFAASLWDGELVAGR